MLFGYVVSGEERICFVVVDLAWKYMRVEIYIWNEIYVYSTRYDVLDEHVCAMFTSCNAYLI